MAHPHLQLLDASHRRIASGAVRIQQSLARLRVVHADPNNPPRAPEGAHAVTVQDARGNVLSYGWCAPIIDRETFLARAFGWKEVLEATPACVLRVHP